MFQIRVLNRGRVGVIAIVPDRHTAQHSGRRHADLGFVVITAVVVVIVVLRIGKIRNTIATNAVFQFHLNSREKVFGGPLKGCRNASLGDAITPPLATTTDAIEYVIKEVRIARVIHVREPFQFIGHPDRLTRPLVRKDGELVPASWDEALDLVAARFAAIKAEHGADALAKRLDQSGVRSAALHGNKSQNARTRALADFKSGKLAVLVATDIAARGIDIDSLPHVVNFELPHVPEDYIHRIGRTGRAGASGQAISLVSIDERIQLRDIERLLKRELESSILPGFEPQQ
ncbi:MAG: hypothetical protein CVV51_04965, partial [Spirochaetae bacterium HGW-Spirochaetae-7]